MRSYIKKWFLTSCVFAQPALIFGVVSCACQNRPTYDLKITGGQDKIIIDQTTSTDIVGMTINSWVVKYNNEELDDSSIVWDIVDNDDPNIFVYNGYIVWYNPQLTNHTFKLKATVKLDDKGTYATCESSPIEFIGDRSLIKFEFYNSDPIANIITATAGQTGKQNTPWILKCNGEAYEKPHANLTLIDENGEQAQGLSVDSTGTISWDETLSPSNQVLYLKTEITDEEQKTTIPVVGSNLPIYVNISNPKFSFSGGKLDGLVKSGEDGVFAKWSVLDEKGIDISESPNVNWQLISAGEKSFGNNISLDKGTLSYKRTLEVGEYFFYIQASDATSGKTIKTDKIRLYCYQPLSIKGGKYNLFGTLGKSESDFSPWSLYSGETKLSGATFDLEAISGITTEQLKLRVKLVDTPTLNGDDVYVKWDDKLTAGKFEFKIKATYQEQVIESTPIMLSIYDEQSPQVILTGFDGNFTVYTTKQSGSNSQTILPPYNFYLSNGYLFDRKNVTYKITCDPQQYENLFSIDENSRLVWEKLDTIKAEHINNTFSLKITASVNISGQTRSDYKMVKINFVDPVGGKAIIPYGKSYNASHDDDYAQFSLQGGSSQYPSMLQNRINIPWDETTYFNKPWSDTSKEVSYYTMVSSDKGRRTTNKSNAQFQHFRLAVFVPKQSRFSATLYLTKSEFVVAHRVVLLDFYAHTSFNRVEIYDFHEDENKLPAYCYGPTTGGRDKTSSGYAKKEYHPSFGSSGEHKYNLELQPLHFSLLNETNEDQIMYYYFGLSAFSESDYFTPGMKLSFWHRWTFSFDIINQTINKLN